MSNFVFVDSPVADLERLPAGMQVIDLSGCDLMSWVRMEWLVEEPCDEIVSPDVGRPMELGFETDEIKRVLCIRE